MRPARPPAVQPPDPPAEHRDLEALLSHADFLRALARGLLGDEHGAEDLVQDTWVAALEHPPRAAGSPRAWLATVARNLAFNAGRGARRRKAREQHAAGPELQPSHEESVERLELLRVVLELVLGLREPYRSVVYLRYYEGLGAQAIAERRRVPVASVKTQLARARAILRAGLDARAGGRSTWTAGLLAVALPRPSLASLAAATSAWIGGALVVKKLAVVALVLALSFWAWRELRDVASPASAPAQTHAESPASSESAIAAVSEPQRAASEPGALRESVPVAGTPAAAPSSGELLVRLRWKLDGRPASGIGLDARCQSDPAPREERFHAESNAQGQVLFAKLFPGSVDLISDRGFAWSAEVVAGERREVELALPAGSDVEGRVLDPDGQPVAGASIWVEGRPEVWPMAHALARTRADGSFRVQGLGDDALLGARAPGWSPSLSFELAGLPVGQGAAREVTLSLGPPCGSVAGRVLGPAGEPIAGALVKLGPAGGGIVDLPSGLRGTQAHPVPVQTDALGGFLYPGDLEAGWQPAHVQARGFPSWSGGVEVRCGERGQLEVRLALPARVRGRVLLPDGTPAGGMQVRARASTGSRDVFGSPTTESNEDGSFLLDWVAAGRQELEASHWKRSRLGKGRASVLAVAGETSTVELVLSTGLTVAGRVVDGEGRPLVGWRVLAEPLSFGTGEQAYDQTDGEGAFLLANLSPGALRIQTSAPGEPFLPARAEATVEAGARDLELVVAHASTPPARVRGRLLDVDGSVPVHAELTVYPRDGERGLFIEFDPASGAFEHAATLPGSYILNAIHGGRTLGTFGPFELHAGRCEDVGVLRLEPPGGVEVAFAGVPPEDLAQLEPMLNRTRHGTEDLHLEGDRFRSRGLLAGTWILHVREGPWYVVEREVEVRPGETTRVEVQAQRAYPVDLGLSFADPKAAWAQTRAEIRSEQGTLVRRSPTWWPAALQEGRLSFWGLTLPQGRFEVSAWTDTGMRASAWIEVAGGSATEGPHTLVLH